MRILITGGAGLIGKAIAKAHLKRHDEIYIWDNKSNKFNSYDEVNGIDVSHLSIEEAIKIVDPEIISHQAAKVGVGESQYEVMSYIENNIGLTSRIIEFLIKNPNNVKKIIHAGSMGPYGEGRYRCCECGNSFFLPKRTKINIKCEYCVKEHNNVENYPMEEWFILSPQSIYASTKQTQEDMWRVFSEIKPQTKVCSLRYFSVYDTRCNPNNPYTGVLSIIANKAINSEEIILNEDGTQTRDLIHTDDIAQAHIQASLFDFENLKPKDLEINFKTFNIGTGISLSMKEIAERMVKALKIDKEIKFNNQKRCGDVKHSKAYIGSSKAYLKWEPKISIYDSIELYGKYILENWDKFKTEDTCQKADEKLKKYNLFKGQ